MKFLNQLRALFRKDRLDAEMTEEMRLHVELHTERNMAAGMDSTEARYAALRQFGNVGSIQEQAREVRSVEWIDRLLRTVRFALRSLGRSPGFALTVILTLVLGIGVSTAIFSVVHAVLLSPLKYRDPGDLVQLQARHPEQGVAGVAPATFGDVTTATDSFAALAAQYYYYINLTGTETPTLLNSADVTADYFRVLGVDAMLGRTWQPAEVAPGAAPVVVLSHDLWQSQFGGRESLVGEPVMLDHVAYTVIGIMPPSFKDPAEVAQLWRPMRPGADNLSERNSHYWTAFGRLKPGVGLREANGELAVLARRMAQAHPADYEGWTLQADDLRKVLVGDHRARLLVVLGAVACVMLITCANVTGLSLVRAAVRCREMAVRTALGSSRGQLVRLLLAENLLLALAGGAGGVLVARWGVDALVAGLPAGWLPRATEIAVNLPVLVATFTLTVVAGVATGLVPGLVASKLDAQEALKDSARSSTSRSSQRWRAALIVAEIALALLLVTGTGLLGRSFLGLMKKDPGVDAGRVLSLTVSLSGKDYAGPVQWWDFFSRAQGEVAALPGVEAAGFTHTSPFRWGIPVAWTPAGTETAAARADATAAFTDAVSVDYFKAMGVPLKAGRLFTAADDHRARPMVILSEAAARRYFGREEAAGRFVVVSSDPKTRVEVVGVVGDVHRAGLTAGLPLQVYRPMAQRTPPFATLMVRTSLPPAALAKAVQAAIWRIDADTPLSEIATLDTFVRRSVALPRLYLVLFGVFAGLAVLLSSLGLYGLIAYSVTQRTRELGIRVALGANPRDVLALVLREGARLIAVGLAAGLVATLLTAGLLEKLVYETSPYDPAVLLVVPPLLGAVGLGACFIPACRALRVDPAVALRAE